MVPTCGRCPRASIDFVLLLPPDGRTLRPRQQEAEAELLHYPYCRYTNVSIDNQLLLYMCQSARFFRRIVWTGCNVSGSVVASGFLCSISTFDSNGFSQRVLFSARN